MPSRTRPPHRVFPGLLIAAPIIAGIALGGCGTAPSSSSGPATTATPTGLLFARGLDDITDLYIEPVSTKTLVAAGAAHLTKLDSKLAATLGAEIRDRNQLTLSYAGDPVATFQVPDDNNGQSGAQTLAAVIAAAKKASPAVAAASEDAIDRAIFDGMVSALDRFSRYAPPDVARDQRAARDGFGGIGVTLDTSGGNDEFRIVGLTADGPAARAGLQVGDKIVAIDGRPTAKLEPKDVIHALRGPLGGPVTLAIERRGVAGTRDYRLQRALVVVPTVTASRDGSIGVFQVASFNQNTTLRLSEAIADMRRQAGGRLSGIVLDLRGNPGGLLDQAVSLTDLFVPSGPIIATVGRHPASHQNFSASGRSIAPDTPIVVLINGGSASASEIVAAALQDVRRAVVIGSSSYGKGTVQTVMRLPNDGELILTWARLVTPSGYLLQQHGVIPSVCTGTLGDDDRSLDLALQQERTAAATAQPRATRDENGWAAMREACPARGTTPAIDLKIAERLLADPARFSAALNATGAPAASGAAQTAAPGPALTAVDGAVSSPSRSPPVP